MGRDLASNQNCRITDIALLVAGFYFYTCIYESSQFWAFLAFVAVTGLYFLKDVHQSSSKQEHLGSVDESPSKTNVYPSSALGNQVFASNFYNTKGTKYLNDECANKIALPPTEHDDEEAQYCSVYEEGFIDLGFAICTENNGTDKDDKGTGQQAEDNKENETSNNGGNDFAQCIQNMNIGGVSAGDGDDEGDGSDNGKGQKENRTCGSNMVKKKKRKKKKTRKKKVESLDANVASNPTSGEANRNQGSKHNSVDEHGQLPCAVDSKKESPEKSQNDPMSSDVDTVEMLSKTIEKYQKSGIIFPYFNKDELGLCDGFYRQGDEYTVVTIVGSGCFGTCELITDLSLKKNIVRKEVKTSDVMEATVMLHLDKHPNVVMLLGADCKDGKLHLFMNYADGGSLKKYMSEIGFSKVPLYQKLEFAHEIISGLVWLKKRCVLHRDLKTDNVLVFCGNSLHAKIADFGHSVILSCDCLLRKDGFSVFHHWTSPEIFHGDAYSFGADLWSALCILYHLETGGPPWQECTSVFQLIYQVGSCKELPVLDDVSVQTRRIYVRGFCLQELRPDAEVFLQLIGEAIEHQHLLSVTSMG